MLLTARNAWKNLKALAEARGITASDPTHRQDFTGETSASTDAIALDYRAASITPPILQALLALAQECNVDEWISALMTGYPVNASENKPALHTALRVFDSEPIWVNGVDVVLDVKQVRAQMRVISTQIRQGEWLGFSGKPITDVVNLGIGGSQLGPQFCMDALTDWVTDTLQFHFLSDMDSNAFRRTTQRLNPETTLFIVSSKSFTTQETLENAKRAFAWIGLENKAHFDKHFIAVTAFPQKAKAFGIEQVCPIWDRVGGRYSVCSAISLITCIGIGFDNFCALLQGANAMDKHFRTTDLADNVPVLFALLGIWNTNFLHTHTVLMLTYAQSLQAFVPFIQQLEMESNGKSLDKQGRAVNYATAPIVWGGLGYQAQHSYYQLLCQGTHRIAVDLISVDSLDGGAVNRLCGAHQKILSQGYIEETDANRYIPGKMPLNHIQLRDCTPHTIGSLIALYEHKVFVQGIIWNINSFDQPAVESSKQLMRSKEELLV